MLTFAGEASGSDSTPTEFLVSGVLGAVVASISGHARAGDVGGIDDHRPPIRMN